MQTVIDILKFLGCTIMALSGIVLIIACVIGFKSNNTSPLEGYEDGSEDGLPPQGPQPDAPAPLQTEGIMDEVLTNTSSPKDLSAVYINKAGQFTNAFGNVINILFDEINAF